MSTQESTGSSLSNVFGSHVSLAELNGDVASRSTSRFPSRAPSPRPNGGANSVGADSAGSSAGGAIAGASAGSATTKRARSRTMTARSRPKLGTTSLVLRCLVMYAAGAISCYGAAEFVAAGRLGPHLAQELPKVMLPAINTGAMTALLIGLVFARLPGKAASSTNPSIDSRPGSSGGSAPPTLLHTHYDWPSFVRGTGAIMGLCYATTKMQSAWMFWGLANPVLWYVIDSSLAGFAFAAVFSVLGGGIAVNWLGCDYRDGLIVLSCFFSAAIMWGGLGRRLSVKDRPVF